MPNISSDVQAGLWFAGVANLITRATTKGYEGEQSPNSGESRLVGGPVIQKSDIASDASPDTWVSARSAPFYFEAGSADKAVPPQQVYEMRSALDKFHIYSEIHILEGVGHGGGEFFDAQHFSLMVKFLKRTLSKKKTAKSTNASNSAVDDFGGSKTPGAPVDIFQLRIGDEHEKWILQLQE